MSHCYRALPEACRDLRGGSRSDYCLWGQRRGHIHCQCLPGTRAQDRHPEDLCPGADLSISPSTELQSAILPENAAVAFLSREGTVHFILKYLDKDCSLKEPILADSHVPEGINLKYRKWINPDLMQDVFKLGYKPPLPTSFLPQVHEEVQELFEPWFSPLLAEDAVVCPLPDTCIITCEHDVLRDEGLLYKKRLEDNNVRVTWHHVEKGFHSALGFFGYGIFSFPSSSTIMNHAVDFIKGY